MTRPTTKASQGPRRLRSDTQRNQRRVFEAVAQIARESPESLTMQTIASRAEIGPATAYRYYSTIDHVLVAYALGVVEQLRDFSTASTLEGRELFDAVLEHWMALLEEHGAAMIQLRSRRGFLERLHADDDIIRTVDQAWRKPILGLLSDAGLPAGIIEHGLFLHNIMFDPREIDDLRNSAHLSPSTVAQSLTNAYVGAIKGWAGR